MNHWLFVTGAYVFTLAGTLGLVWTSYRAMRRAESEAAKLNVEATAMSPGAEAEAVSLKAEAAAVSLKDEK